MKMKNATILKLYKVHEFSMMMMCHKPTTNIYSFASIGTYENIILYNKIYIGTQIR